MAIDFPSSPTTGQSVTVGGVTWTWDGVKWTTSGSAGPAMPLAMNDNRIINGDMRIDQRNNGASGTANGYTVDRWQYFGSAAAKGTWGRTGPTSSIPGFPYWLGFTSSSAYTPTAGQIFQLTQPLEGDAVSDFAWGSANAQPVILSFWVSSSLTGTFSGAIVNWASNRSYPFSFSFPTANVWVKIVITIPGDTAGTWVMSGNGGSMYISFDLGSGATYRAPANAWAAGAFYGVTGAVNVVATNGATFAVTGVKLEVGSVATPFNRKSLAASMADCQRYYSVLNPWFAGYASASGQNIGFSMTYPATMRAAPTVAITLVGSTLLGTVVAVNTGAYSTGIYAPSTAAGSCYFQVNATMSAEL